MLDNDVNTIKIALVLMGMFSLGLASAYRISLWNKTPWPKCGPQNLTMFTGVVWPSISAGHWERSRSHKKERFSHKSHVSLSSTRSPRSPNWCEKTLFTPFIEPKPNPGWGPLAEGCMEDLGVKKSVNKVFFTTSVKAHLYKNLSGRVF